MTGELAESGLLLKFAKLVAARHKGSNPLLPALNKLRKEFQMSIYSDEDYFVLQEKYKELQNKYENLYQNYTNLQERLYNLQDRNSDLLESLSDYQCIH